MVNDIAYTVQLLPHSLAFALTQSISVTVKMPLKIYGHFICTMHVHIYCYKFYMFVWLTNLYSCFCSLTDTNILIYMYVQWIVAIKCSSRKYKHRSRSCNFVHLQIQTLAPALGNIITYQVPKLVPIRNTFKIYHFAFFVFYRSLEYEIPNAFHLFDNLLLLFFFFFTFAKGYLNNKSKCLLVKIHWKTPTRIACFLFLLSTTNSFRNFPDLITFSFCCFIVVVVLSVSSFRLEWKPKCQPTHHIFEHWALSESIIKRNERHSFN